MIITKQGGTVDAKCGATDNRPVTIECILKEEYAVCDRIANELSRNTENAVKSEMKKPLMLNLYFTKSQGNPFPPPKRIYLHESILPCNVYHR